MNELNDNLAGKDENDAAEICSFEYDVKNSEEDEAFRVFQKKYVLRKNVIKTAAFAVLALGFGYSSYKYPSSSLNFILTGVCIAAIAVIWFNVRYIRISLLNALKVLEDDRYIFKLYDDRFTIETIATEEEKQEEDYAPIPPSVIMLDDEMFDPVETEDKFILIIRKETIYVLPKRCMNEQQAETLRKVLIDKKIDKNKDI